MAVTFHVTGKDSHIFIMIAHVPDQFYYTIKYHLYFFVRIAPRKK